MIDDIIVIDNIVNNIYQDTLEKAFLSEMNIPWFLLDDVAYPGNSIHQQNPGIVHPMIQPGQEILSPVYNLVLPLLYESCSRINFPYTEVIRARAFMQFPNKSNVVNHPHVDYNDPHLVCLYYVNDSDGETVLYEETTNDVINLPGISGFNFIIKQKVQPKKGRVVLFNGNRYHSSSTPVHNRRCVVNFDVK